MRVATFWRGSGALALGLGMACAPACIGSKARLRSEDRERLRDHILDAVPASARRIDVNFEGKVHLVGVSVDPALAPPGSQVKLTYYWRCDEPLDDGWQLFTHVQHEGSARTANLDGVGPLRELRSGRQVLGPDVWERGRIYADEQTLTMPADVRGPESVVYVGIYKGNARLRIVSGPTDGDNRAIVAKVNTGVAAQGLGDDPARSAQDPARVRARAPLGLGDVPELRVPALPESGRISIDGVGDDEAWKNAASTGPFVNVATGQPATSERVTGSAKLTWDTNYLYVLIDVNDPDVRGFFTTPQAQPGEWTATNQPMTWNHDTAEIMIDPDGDGDNRDYFEIQINPINKVFKSRFDSYNLPKVEPLGPFGHEDWDARMVSAVRVRGTLDDSRDSDDGYTVEAKMAWSAFANGAKVLPPKPGDAWRVNVYAMENNGGTAWSPILGKGNFHRASRFGRITWAAAPDRPSRDAGRSP